MTAADGRRGRLCADAARRLRDDRGRRRRRASPSPACPLAARRRSSGVSGGSYGSRSWSSASRPATAMRRRAAHRAMRPAPSAAASARRPVGSARIRLPSAADADAAHRCARSAPTGARRPSGSASCSTPSMASPTGTRAPITRSRSNRSSATSRRRPPSSTRMCRELVGARGRRRAHHACAANSASATGTAIAASWQARRSEPLRPLRSRATTGRVRPSCSNTTPTRRPRCSRPRCSSGCGSRTRSRARSSRATPTSTIRCTSG